MSLSKVRMFLWIVVVLALVGFGILSLRSGPVDEQGQVLDLRSSIGGPFTLVDAAGEPFSSQRLVGRPHVVFFGFTHCPDICPNTLALLSNYREEIGEDAFDIVFITVDPARDGPEEVGQYADLFDTPVIGLTGSEGQIEKVKDQFGVTSEQVPDEFGGYTVNHTATVFLMDRDGNFVSTLALEEGREPALAKLRRIAQ